MPSSETFLFGVKMFCVKVGLRLKAPIYIRQTKVCEVAQGRMKLQPQLSAATILCTVLVHSFPKDVNGAPLTGKCPICEKAKKGFDGKVRK